MKLIAEKLGKFDKYDRLRFVRADGSQTQAAMPRQGTLPHDLVHYVVESALSLKHGFLGLIASGSEAGFVMQAIHAPGSPTVEWEAAQAEAVVEALQTQLWAGTFDLEAFLEGARSASASRGQAPLDWTGLEPRTVLYDSARALLDRWSEVPYHRSMELQFAPGTVRRLPVSPPEALRGSA